MLYGLKILLLKPYITQIPSKTFGYVKSGVSPQNLHLILSFPKDSDYMVYEPQHF